jgi:hypothetical protein
VIVVTASAILGGHSTPAVGAGATAEPAVSAQVAGATSTAAVPSPNGSLAIGALASLSNPRVLPPPDLAAAVPAGCRGGALAAPLEFQTTIGQLPALVYIVRCTATLAFGPLVFVPSTTGWQLRASGGQLPIGAQAGFSGAITAASANEFGIVWDRGDGIGKTVSLFRIGGDAVSRFWDSSEAGMLWSLATFQWRASQNAARPGQVVVVDANLSTGTKGCTTCKDHDLSRKFYDWKAVNGVGRLVLTRTDLIGKG